MEPSASGVDNEYSLKVKEHVTFGRQLDFS